LKRIALALGLGLILAPGAQATHTPEFEIFVKTRDNPETPQAEPSRNVLNAPYAKTLPSGAGWLDGDREAYDCAYTFLRDAQGNLVGRVLFKTIGRAGAYTVVNDQFMHEGSMETDIRWWPDGRPANEQGTICRDLPSEPYEELDPADNRKLPLIRFRAADGSVLETRDYATRPQLDPGNTQRVVSVTPERVTAVAYQDGIPIVSVYYEPMGNGQVTCDRGCSDESSPSTSPSAPPSPFTADFDSDGDVDVDDLAEFVAAWIRELLS
jgi:hypothetical protein